MVNYTDRILKKAEITKDQNISNALRKFDREKWNYLNEGNRLKVLNEMALICEKKYEIK